MLFNTIEFLFIFLPITFFVYFFLNKKKFINLATGWLVLASLFFYSYWKIDYLPLILLSMVFNYTVGRTLSDKSKLKIDKKLLMIIGVAGNILLLGYYKYFDFLIYNLNMVFKADFNYMHIVLPLAISFFTFQQIAYLVDSYHGLTKEYDFLTYSLFVTFFPQLIAGPIVHHKEMMPQFARLRNRLINHKNIAIGLFLLAVGLTKNVLLADFFSPFVQQTFDVIPHSLSCFESWCAAISYTFQLYFDFSGYCDMAMGVGYLFNIVLPQNFNSPYKCTNIQDFWRRWHMTLSRWLKDYVYIPLGGNRHGKFNTYKNLFLTFLIGGIWHGANWTFVLWGALHGLASCIHRFFAQFEWKFNKYFATLFMFLFINITWVPFRATTIHKALDIYKSMIGLNGFEPIVINKLRFAFENNDLKLSFFLIIPAIIIVFCIPNSVELAKKFRPNWIYTLCTFLMLTASVITINRVSEFLYFQF